MLQRFSAALKKSNRRRSLGEGVAFENLQPVTAQILAWRNERVSLQAIAERLASEHGIATSAGSLSRYLTVLQRAPRPEPDLVRPPPIAKPLPPISPAAVTDADTTALLADILEDVEGARAETRDVLQMVAGKVNAASADVVELEKAMIQLRQDLTGQIAKLAVAAPAPAPVVAIGKVSGSTLVKIWIRAAIVTFIAWAGIAGFLVLLLNETRGG